MIKKAPVSQKSGLPPYKAGAKYLQPLARVLRALPRRAPQRLGLRAPPRGARGRAGSGAGAGRGAHHRGAGVHNSEPAGWAAAAGGTRAGTVRTRDAIRDSGSSGFNCWVSISRSQPQTVRPRRTSRFRMRSAPSGLTAGGSGESPHPPGRWAEPTWPLQVNRLRVSRPSWRTRNRTIITRRGDLGQRAAAGDKSPERCFRHGNR